MSLLVEAEKGWVLQDQERVIILRATTFQRFADQLIATAGAKVGGLLLYHMGSMIGQIAFETSKQITDHSKESCKALDGRMQVRGWGRCMDMIARDEGRDRVYSLTVKDSPEAYRRKSMEPTCHVLRGIVSGWLESQIGRKASSSSEIKCSSVGEPFCVFEVSFPKPSNAAQT